MEVIFSSFSALAPNQQHFNFNERLLFLIETALSIVNDIFCFFFFFFSRLFHRLVLWMLRAQTHWVLFLLSHSSRVSLIIVYTECDANECKLYIFELSKPLFISRFHVKFILSRWENVEIDFIFSKIDFVNVIFLG